MMQSWHLPGVNEYPRIHIRSEDACPRRLCMRFDETVVAAATMASGIAMVRTTEEAAAVGAVGLYSTTLRPLITEILSSCVAEMWKGSLGSVL